MKRHALTLALVFAVCAALGFGWTAVFAQTNHTYTCTWTNDGVSVDGYAIVVDGVSTNVQATCTGSGGVRLCTSPLTMTVGVDHVVTVVAYNAFGSVSSPPFTTAPPKGAVSGVTVK